MCEKNTLWDKSRLCFCGATQIDGESPPALSMCQHTPFPLTVEIRRVLLGDSVRPALGSPFGRGASAAIPPPAALLGKNHPAYFSASSVSLQRFNSLNCSEYTKPGGLCQEHRRVFCHIHKRKSKSLYTSAKGPGKNTAPRPFFKMITEWKAGSNLLCLVSGFPGCYTGENKKERFSAALRRGWPVPGRWGRTWPSAFCWWSAERPSPPTRW